MLVAVAIVALLLGACGGDGEGTPTATSPAGGGTPSGATEPAGTPSGGAETATPEAGAAAELVVITHDSFDAQEEVIARFEQEHNARVVLVQAGDANELVNRAILSAGNPEADVLFGIDNLTFLRARDAEVFEEYESARRGEVPEDIRAQFDDSLLVTPVDYGFVDLNYDKAAEVEPPGSFEDLVSETYRGTLAVMDPATSSPGLQFLASTVAHFGEGGWQEFWRGLRANDVLVVDGWSEAYYTHFSHYGGDRPLVVSYTTSPAAEVFFAEEPVEEPPTENVVLGGRLFRQVEAAGVLRGTDQPELAGAFIDFMLSDAFQQQIPETMFVYPVIPDLELPEWWRWAEVDVEPAEVEATEADIEGWIREWTEIMRR